LDTKKQLIQDIQNLLNTYDGITPTSINPELLKFLDEQSLKDIIGNLLDQKESFGKNEDDVLWLEQFKTK